MKRLQRTGSTLLLLLSTAGWVGCDKEDAKTANQCEADTDCKNGTLCEGKMCIPNEVAELARSARTAQSQKKEDSTKKAPPSSEKDEPTAEKKVEDDGPIPLIPKDNSPPPQGDEWSEGVEVNTQNIHGIAPNCTVKVLREWLRVVCRGKVLGYEKMQGFGAEKADYFVSIREGKLASFVVRIKQGPKQKVRICREDNQASLVVHWPAGKERPAHIALGTGPKCDSSEWGATTPDPKGTLTPKGANP